MLKRLLLALSTGLVLVFPALAQTVTNVQFNPNVATWGAGNIGASFTLGGFTQPGETVNVTFTRDDGAVDFRTGLSNGTNTINLVLSDLGNQDGRTTTYNVLAVSSAGSFAQGGPISLVFDNVAPRAPVVTVPASGSVVFSDVVTLQGFARRQDGTPQTSGTVFVISQTAPNTGQVIGAGAIRSDSLFLATVDLSAFPIGATVSLNLVAGDDVPPNPGGNQSAPTTFQIIRRQAVAPTLTTVTCQPANGGLTNAQGVLVRGTVTGIATQRFKVYFFVDGALSSEISDLPNNTSFAHTVNLPSDGLHEIRIQGALDADPTATPPRQADPPDLSRSIRACALTRDTRAPGPPFIVQPTSIDETFRTSTPTFNLVGFSQEAAFTTTGPFPSITLAGPTGVTFSPASPIRPDSSGRFTSTVGLNNITDGFYTLNIASVDPAGNTTPGSIARYTFIRDTTAPTVDRVRVNGFLAPQNNPEIYVGRQLVQIELRANEDMLTSPRLQVLQNGGAGIVAGLSTVSGRIFTYNFVPANGRDGPSDLRADQGLDLARNTMNFSLNRVFIVDTTPPNVVSVSPPDGTTGATNRTPERIRVVFQDPASAAGTASGMDLLRSTVRVIGPIEGAASPISGTTLPFDPVTVDFIPTQQITADGTYEVRVVGVDKVGNIAQEVIRRFTFDATPIRLRPGLFACLPDDRAFVNPDTIPGGADSPFVLAIVSDPQFDAVKSSIDVSDFCRVPPLVPGTKEVVDPATLRYNFRDPLATDGSQDGTYLTRILIRDSAGNTSPETFCTFVYDSLKPTVERFFPPDRSFINGPLRIVDATLMDPLPDNCRTRSGIDRASSDIRLVLETPNQVVNKKTPGEIRGVLRFVSVGALDRLLLEIVDRNNVPVGLANDGTDDGVYRMFVAPVDRSQNVGDVTTATFTYDTLRPDLTVDKLANNQVVTGPEFMVKGLARDNLGGSGLDRVVASLFSVDDFGNPTTSVPVILNTTGVLVPAPVGSPTRFQGYVIRGDLFNVQDPFLGRLIISAIDRAGNRTEKQFNVRVQAEPMVPPILSVPRNKFSTNSQIVDFAWEGVQGAADYEVRFLTPKRNDIRRRTGGVITLRENLALLSDGDGEYFWSAAAIDGGCTVQPFARNVSFFLDTKPPRVAAVDVVDPSPESNGVLTAGEVRFKITFDEPMDTNRPLTVALQPESPGATPLPLDVIQFEQNIWIGSTRIPETAEGVRDVNGLGELLITGGRDKAGNPMQPPQNGLTVYEIDTGPLLRVGFFRNPVDRNDLVVVVKAFTRGSGIPERLVEPPTVTFSRSGENDQVPEFRRINESSFQGTFRLNTRSSSDINLRVTGRDEQGNTLTRTFVLDVALVAPGASDIVISPTQSIRLQVLAHASSAPQALFTIPWNLSLSPGGGAEPAPESLGPLVPVAPLDQFGPTGLSFDGTAGLEVDLARVEGVTRPDLMGKAGIYRWDGSHWVYIAQSRNGQVIQAQLETIEPLALLHDPAPPEIKVESPGPEGKIDPADPELVLTVSDQGSGIDPDQLVVEVDGSRLVAAYSPESGTVRADLSQLTSDREHRLEMTIADRAGNIVRQSRALTGGAEFAVSEFLAVPNPARITTMLRYRLHQPMDEVDLRIYDATGKRVARLFSDTSAGLHSADWDLTTEQGSRVGAGVYFCRLTARCGDRKIKQVAKIAVLP